MAENHESMSIPLLLSNPESFFRERRSTLSLSRAVLVVVAIGALSAAAAYPTARATGRLVSATAGLGGDVAVLVSLVTALVTVVVTWLLYAAVIHAISTLAYDGESTLRDSLAVTGWGYLPLALSAIPTAIASYLVYWDWTPPDGGQNAVQTSFQQLQSSPEMVASTLISVGLTLWAAMLWIHGIRIVGEVTLREAIVSVGVPVALGLIFQVWTLV